MTTEAWRSGKTQAEPEEIGFEAAQLERLEAIFEALLGAGKVQAASYCISRHGRVFANRSIGSRRYDGKQPMESGTFRRIASITKVITSLGIMKLVETGRLIMELPIGHYLKEFDTATHAKIRLSHLLTHSSGLPADPGSNGEANPDHLGFWEAARGGDWLSWLVAQPLAHEPGARWCYGSVGFMLLGEIITRAAGEPFHVWLTREILEPAGLHDTFFDPCARDNNQFCIVSAEEESRLAFAREHGLHAMAAMGGAYSTCPDLVRLGQLFLERGSLAGKRIVGATTVEAMRRIHLTAPAPHWGDHFPDWQYGLGIEPARHPLIQPGAVWGHEGAGRCAWLFAPEHQLTAAWTLPTTLDFDPHFCWTPRAVIWAGIS
ncbi:MAG: serine hydrolase domain-containing protein [Pseudomonadota bacterium]